MKFISVQNHFLNVDNIEDVFFLYIHDSSACNYYLRCKSGQTIKISLTEFKKIISTLGALS